MVKSLSKSLFLLLVIGTMLLGMVNFVSAQNNDGTYGLDTATDTANAGDKVLDKGSGATASDSLAKGLGKMVGALLAFLGVIFLILMIYGGVLWMTAAGNDQQIGKARTLIVAAIIGLLIVLSAYAITSYLADNIDFS
ncbi:MAG: hypothetical protein V1765_03560 [bacterium]